MSEEVVFPSESEIEKNQQLFKEKFADLFTSKRKKYDTLLKKAKQNARESGDAVDSAEPNTAQNGSDNTEGESSTFDDIYNMTLGRSKKNKAQGIYRTLSKVGDDSIGELMKRVSAVISVAFQYQLGFLDSPKDVEKAAKFAVRAIMHYLKSPDAVFTEAALIEALLEDKVKVKLNEDIHVKTKFPQHKGYKGIYWTAEGIFREPGIFWPKNILDNHTENKPECNICFTGSFTPFGYSCRQEIYGYRAPIHIRNSEGKSVLLLRDRTTLCHEKNPACRSGDECDNIHRLFKPKLPADTTNIN